LKTNGEVILSSFVNVLHKRVLVFGLR